MQSTSPARPRVHPSRGSFAILLVLVCVLAGLPASMASAAVDATAEQDFVTRVNAERASRGLSPLTACAELRTVARRHSVRMADANHLHHNPNLASDVLAWARLAENVGRGSGVASLHRALMDSEGHRLNILDGRVTQIGVGVEVSPAGQVWVTQVFRQPRAGAECTPVSQAAATTSPSISFPSQVHLSGDFTGDGEQDLATFDPSTGEWRVTSYTATGSVTKLWGRFSTRSGWETHLVGDFDGDGRDDVASFHPVTGNWVVSRSSGSGFGSSVWTRFSTRSGWETHLVGDFDGDGRDDVASFHPVTGNWVVSRSESNGLFQTAKL
jgi:uncharacterized protein YkwD